MMKNWKTTLAGVGVILAAVGNAIGQYAKGGIGAIDYPVLFAGLSAGIGLIAAKDFNISGGALPPAP